MRYKYSCKSCKLTDIRKFVYSENTNIPICLGCGEDLKSEFMQPPQSWMEQQRNIT